jgi:hypothetical protein
MVGATTVLTCGSSMDPRPAVAAAEAVARALQAAPCPVFGIVFSTCQYESAELAAGLSAAFGGVPWAGCCTAGVFAGRRLLRPGLVVGVLSSQTARVRVGVGGPLSDDPRGAGEQAAAAAVAGLGPLRSGTARAMLLLPDAMRGNAAEVVRGAVREAGSAWAWAGGGAGHNLNPTPTTQFAHGVALTDHVVAVALETPGALAVGMRHGWRPYGPPAVVTRASGCVVLELNGEPAYDVYRRAAHAHGDEVTVEGFGSFAVTHPLGFPQANGTHVIRDPLRVTQGGGLQCVAEVPEGCLIRVMEGNAEALVAAARSAALDARRDAGGEVGGAIVFDCISRSLVLGDAYTEELAAIEEGLGPGVPFIGCLTFGEVGTPRFGVPQFHNKTAVVLAWSR